MFASLCQVQRFTSEWRRIVERFGYVAESTGLGVGSAFWYIFAPKNNLRRWIDFDNDYKTMDRSFMERRAPQKNHDVSGLR